MAENITHELSPETYERPGDMEMQTWHRAVLAARELRQQVSRRRGNQAVPPAEEMIREARELGDDDLPDLR